MLVVVETVKGLSYIHDMSGQHGRLILFSGVDDALRKSVEQLDQLVSAVSRYIFRIEGREVSVKAGVSQDAGASGVGLMA